MIYGLFSAFRPRLVTLLLFVFSLLVVPALVVVLTVSHYQSERAIKSHLNAELGRTKSDTNHALRSFFGHLIDVTSVLANSLAYSTSAVKDDGFDELLHRIITSVDHILSITITYEDGFTRHFAQINPDLRAQRPEIPPQAVWGSAVTLRTPSAQHQSVREVFYSDFPTPLSKVTLTGDFPNFQETDGYRGAHSAQDAFITEVRLGTISRTPLVSVAIPIKRKGVFVGAVIANVTVKDLSDFLLSNRVSEHSEAMILDAKGQIVAASGMAHLKPNASTAATTTPAVSALLEGRLIELDTIARGADRDDATHSFTVSYEGNQYSVSDFLIDNAFGLTYRALIITPLNDFVGDMRRSSQNFSLVVLALLLVEALMMIRLARRLSMHINNLSNAIARIRGMAFDADDPAREHNSPVHEVAELQHGVALLQNALRSFALYVPLGVVRKLIEEGKPIAPGVERREMTILFCDLENFSTLAQTVSAESLLEDTTTYFSIATEAITRHGGTVDKFIGDAVMGFWGAPDRAEDHAVRACRAALDIVRGLERTNQAWQARKKQPLRVRVGVNSASVLVGNIGSPDRLSYTTIGDGVNVASRLEAKNKELGSSICISDTTYQLAKDHIKARPLKLVSVKGRTGEFMVYELLDTVPLSEELNKVAQSEESR